MHQIKFLRQVFSLKIVKWLDNKPLWRQQNIRGPGTGAVSYDLGVIAIFRKIVQKLDNKNSSVDTNTQGPGHEQ